MKLYVGNLAFDTTTQDLEKISTLTLKYYNQHADDFFVGTCNHDVSQNIMWLLHYIEVAPPFKILDFGCGPGRDLKVFAQRGHIAVGLDGSKRFAAIARDYSHCEVLEQDFLKLDLPANQFDGVFANASLFHVPSQALPRILSELHMTLKSGAVLFSSNPHGHNEEGWTHGRYGVYYDLETWRCLMSDVGFTELIHYYRPDNLPREQQPWLASVWRRK